MARFIDGASSSANIADFVFTEGSPDEDPSSITIANHDMAIVTIRDDSETDADISITAADDIFIEAIGDDVNISANDDVIISAYNGRIELGASEYIIFSNPDAYLLSDSPENQIATLGDVGIETEYAVSGGTNGTQPTFNGEPLFSASYVRMSSNLVHFQIQVDMDNITSFGTGQYYMTLPFNAKYAYQFREGCLHDIGGEDQFQISGHVAAGSNVMYLFFAQQAAQDEPFTSTAPVVLQTNDNFHVSGTYIAEVAL